MVRTDPGLIAGGNDDAVGIHDVHMTIDGWGNSIDDFLR